MPSSPLGVYKPLILPNDEIFIVGGDVNSGRLVDISSFTVAEKGHSKL